MSGSRHAALWRPPGAVIGGWSYRQLRLRCSLAGGFYEDCKRDFELSLTFLHSDILR